MKPRKENRGVSAQIVIDPLREFVKIFLAVISIRLGVESFLAPE
jgi:hypothetical protein